MRLFQRKFLLLLMIIGLLAGSVSLATSAEQKDCILCGMHLDEYTHVQYTVTDSSGKKYITCGVQCGLILQLNLRDTFQSATMTDLFSHKRAAAENGWYVYKSSVITDMAPGLIGFADKARAKKFIKGFGGELLTYSQALEKAKAGLP